MERDYTLAGVAAGAAESVRSSAVWLHCTYGRGWLPEGARRVTRDVLDRAGAAVPAFRRLIPAAGPGCATQAGLRQAGGAVLGGLVVGAAVGGLVEGSLAAVEARRKGLGLRPGARAAARAAGVGVVSTGAGAAAGVGLLLVLGPVGPGGVMLASFLGSLAARTLVAPGGAP